MSVRKHGKIIAGTTVNPDLFDWKWADHILDNASWLRADTFSWQSGAVYKAAYNHLSDDLHELVLTNDYSTFNKFNLIRWDTASTLGIFQIAWTGNRYVIIYYINNTNTVRYLNKGASGSWSSFSNTNLNGNGHQFRTVEWNGEQLVALAGDGYISFGTIENNDATWTVPVQGPATVTGDSWTRLIWNGSFYLAVTSNTNCVSTSTDGIVWTTPTQVNIPSLYRCLTWDGTRFIALFTNNSQICMSTSTDGLSWTNPVITNLSTKPSSIVWAENKYVGIFSSTISTSTDGITWTERYSSSTGGYSLSYGSVFDGEGILIQGSLYDSGDDEYNISSCYSTITTQSETNEGITVKYYSAPDGHKICPSTEEANVAAIYAATGVAWYYIIDTINQRFKLPRTKFGVTGLRDKAGNYVAPGAPNITGYLGLADRSGSAKGRCTGAFSWNNAQGTNGYAPSTNTDSYDAFFDASSSSSIYGASNTIQPPATQQYLYFYVGNFTQTALQNTAGINAELFNEKLDRDFSNATTDVASSLNNVGARTVVETYASGNNWYRRYSDGWVEQGSDAHNRGSSNRWNFLIGMAGTYNAQITARGSQRYAWVTDMGSTYLTFNAADDSSQNNDGLYYIKVCGYAAS